MMLSKRLGAVFLAAAAGGAASSQPGAVLPPGVRANAPVPRITANLPCPASGYAKPWFGAGGDNDGIQRGYEIASPCIAPETIAAADALGLARFNPIGVKNISTIRFSGAGTIAGDSGAATPAAAIDVAVSYAIPAIRITTTRAGAQPAGRAYADGAAWDEGAPGVGGHAAPGSAATARLPLIRLTPFGAVLAIIEAEGHATITHANGHIVLSGTSPYDNLPVTVTLDEKSRPVAVEVRSGGRRYSATFEDYRDSWESPYLVVFPAHVRWVLNGKPIADIQIARFHSNPYVIFPRPEVLAVATHSAAKSAEK